MKIIKFRGYDTRDGVREMVTFTLDELLAGTDEYELVDPDSVAQFIGYDRNGNEVYDNDKLVEDEQSAFNGTENVNDVAVDAVDALQMWDFGRKFLNFELVKK